MRVLRIFRKKMVFAACPVAVCPVRKNPAHEAEMVNQLFFGDMVEILESGKGNWSLVKGLSDNYEGWVNKQQLESVSEAEARDENFSLIINDQTLHEIRINDSKMFIPAGASLRQFSQGKGRLGKWEFSYSGKDVVQKNQLKAGAAEISRLMRQWLNAPYLWGGRHAMGVDCSGLTQVLFKLMGINLPRDAWQQALEGTTVDFIQQSQPGDLAFFDDENGKIYHVGIVSGQGKIIHASGIVKEDHLDAAGILNVASGNRTHQLRIIKRYF